MGVDLQRLTNTRFATQIGLGVIGRMPTRVGYRVADFAADRLSSQREQSMIAGLRGNLRVAYGESMSSAEFEGVARRTMRNRARALFDFYHTLGRDSEMMAMVNNNPRFTELLEKNVNRIQGAVVVMIHMGNPELTAIACPLLGLRGLGLTFPGESGGYELLNEIRERVGVQAIPTTMASIKKAIQYLKDNGTIFTGLDRPLPESGYQPRFFGKPAPLPVHHVMMALKADVPVVVVGSKRQTDGKYDLLISDFIYMERQSDRKTELLANTERLLAVAEEFIRQAPEQWAMFYPLWPKKQAEIQ
ncbi:MAG TPA: lysophospholipid acyltransferase family protein [Patescibacteria group bacterium]|nr:lysophospholipid acyltransferase family protein [Patescibacteria group bacterium]